MNFQFGPGQEFGFEFCTQRNVGSVLGNARGRFFNRKKSGGGGKMGKVKCTFKEWTLAMNIELRVHQKKWGVALKVNRKMSYCQL